MHPIFLGGEYTNVGLLSIMMMHTQSVLTYKMIIFWSERKSRLVYWTVLNGLQRVMSFSEDGVRTQITLSLILGSLLSIRRNHGLHIRQSWSNREALWRRSPRKKTKWFFVLKLMTLAVVGILKLYEMILKIRQSVSEYN